MAVQKRLYVFFIALIVTFSFASAAIALAPETHKAINKRLSQDTFLDDYLRKQLGISSGKDSFFNNRKFFDLISDGGAEEDAGSRSLNHFHNPLTEKGSWGGSSCIWRGICPFRLFAKCHLSEDSIEQIHFYISGGFLSFCFVSSAVKGRLARLQQAGVSGQGG